MSGQDILATRKTKVVYRDGDKLVKMFNEGYPKSDILNEALNQARVEETDLKVPAILEVTKIDGKWAIISEFIEGKTLATIMEENPDKEDELLEKFVDLQCKVHSQKAPLLNKLKDKMDRKINQADLDAIARYDLHTRLSSMPKHTKVCHGDFNPSNIIVKEDGTMYIIDWSHVTQGNAAADVARTFLLFNLDGKENLSKKYMEMYSQKTGTEISYIQKWIPIVAASQLVKGKEEEKEFLTRWASVVDYE